MSPPSIKATSIPDHIFDTSSGASLLPSCSLDPCDGLDVDALTPPHSPALSLHGPYPWLSADPGFPSTHLQQDSGFNVINRVPDWKRDAAERGGIASVWVDEFRTLELQLQEFER
jgi:hypothetical protein